MVAKTDILHEERESLPHLEGLPLCAKNKRRFRLVFDSWDFSGCQNTPSDKDYALKYWHFDGTALIKRLPMIRRQTFRKEDFAWSFEMIVLRSSVQVSEGKDRASECSQPEMRDDCAYPLHDTFGSLWATFNHRVASSSLASGKEDSCTCQWTRLLVGYPYTRKGLTSRGWLAPLHDTLVPFEQHNVVWYLVYATGQLITWFDNSCENSWGRSGSSIEKSLEVARRIDTNS